MTAPNYPSKVSHLKVASGFPDHVRIEALLLGILLDVLLDHSFYLHQGPAARAPLRHLRPPVFFFPTQGVLKEGDTRRLAQAWLPPPLCTSQLSSICSGVLLFNSTSSLVHSRKIVAFLFAFSLPSGWDPMSGLPNVPLSLSSVLMCLEEVSQGRRLTQNFPRSNRRTPSSSPFTVLSTGSAPVWDSVSHFALFEFGPSPAVTSQLKAARGKQPELWQPFGG